MSEQLQFQIQTKSNPKHIRFIIPCFNEEENVPFIYQKIEESIQDIKASQDSNGNDKYIFHYLFIDDGSSDRTSNSVHQLIEENEKKNKEKYKNNENSSKIIELLTFSRNFGKESAMMAGIDDSVQKTYFDAIIFLDADGQDDPDLIVQMIHEWENGYKDVYAKRVKRERAGLFEKLSTTAFYYLLNYSSKIQIPENVGDYRLLDRECFVAISKMREQNRYTKGIFSYVGFRKKEILFSRPQRKNGNSKWGLMKKLLFALDAFVGFSSILYQMPFFFGTFLMIACIIFGIYDSQLILDETNHGLKKFTFFLFLFGMGALSFSIGIIMKILFMILDETRNRPQYILQKEDNNQKKT